MVASRQMAFLILLCSIWIICLYLFEWGASKLAGYTKRTFHDKQTLNI